MSTPAFILFPRSSVWRVAVVDSSSRARWADAGATVQDVVQALKQLGYGAGSTLMLAIPSKWCMAASVGTSGLPRRDRRALLFRFEEKLPLAAEEIVADFVGSREKLLGVCVRLDLLRPLVDALEAEGVAIDLISPASLLAAQALLRPGNSQVMVLAEPDAISVIGIERDEPAAWSVAPPEPADVALHAGLAPTKNQSGVTRCFGLEPKLTAELPGIEIEQDDPDEAAARMGRLALLGRARPWIDLRRDALAARDRLRAYRRALNAALAAAAALLLAVAGVTFGRAQRYEAAARWQERAMVESFRTEFPGWSVPANVRAVVESEHAKLAARQAATARQASSESALRVLARVLGALPGSSAPILADRMTFDDHGFAIDGRVASLAELDAITSAVRSTGLRVAPPQTQRDGDGTSWRFTLRGELPATPGSGGGSPRLAEVKP
jgi:hypothetical protein